MVFILPSVYLYVTVNLPFCLIKLRGRRLEFPNYDVLLSLKIVFFISANSANLDKMLHFFDISSGFSLFAKVSILRFQ